MCLCLEIWNYKGIFAVKSRTYDRKVTLKSRTYDQKVV